MEFAVVVVHIIISLLLIAIVVIQQSKQQGLSSSVAGNNETFYGKNKGRTFDALLSKITAVLAAAFVVTSITLSLFVNKAPSDSQLNDFESQQTMPQLDLQIDESSGHVESSSDGSDGE